MSNSYREQQVMYEHERRWIEPDPDPAPYAYCSCCGCELYSGEKVWNIFGDLLCEDCAENQYTEVLPDE